MENQELENQESNSSGENASLSVELTEAGIDPAVLDMLNKLMGQEAFFGLIESYLARTNTYLQAIAEHIANNDFDELHFVAHTLKGSSANIGVMALSALCAKLDDKAVQRDAVEEIKKSQNQVMQQFELSKQVLENYLLWKKTEHNKVA